MSNLVLQALYDYEARNEDELSFAVNDIIMVHPEQVGHTQPLEQNMTSKINIFLR